MFALALVGRVSADEADQGKGKKKTHAIHGKVAAVQKDSDKDGGAIEVAIHHKKKGAAGSAAVKLVKIKITPDTKFEKVHREGKGDIDRKPAVFADVRKGEHVRVVPMEGASEVAQRVEIVVGKKAKP
jgi:hypothetical protein